MNDSRDFKKEYEAFLKKVPYQTAVLDDVKVRYQYGGKDGAPVILFFNGLEMQEMWMPYVPKSLEKNTDFWFMNIRSIQPKRTNRLTLWQNY